MTDRERDMERMREAYVAMQANHIALRWMLAVDALEAAVWGNPREFSRIAAAANQAIARAKRG